MCAYVMPDIPTCDSFISKDILDKFIAIGNVNAISAEEIKALAIGIPWETFQK